MRSGEGGGGVVGVGGRVRDVWGIGEAVNGRRQLWVAAPRAQWRNVQGEMRARERGPSSSEMEGESKRGRKGVVCVGVSVAGWVMGPLYDEVARNVDDEVVSRVDEERMGVVGLCFDGALLLWGSSCREG